MDENKSVRPVAIDSCINLSTIQACVMNEARER